MFLTIIFIKNNGINLTIIFNEFKQTLYLIV